MLDTEQKESIKTLLLALWKKDNETFNRSVLYFQLRVMSGTPIYYSIKLLKFYIPDQRQRKYTAVQESEVVQLHISCSGHFLDDPSPT